MFRPLIYITALLFTTTLVYADVEQIYAGAGVTRIQVHSTHEAIGQQSVTGFHLVGGGRLGWFGLDVSISGATIDTGEVPDPYYPPDRADYGIFDFELRFYIPLEFTDRFSPWIGAGLSIHSFEWDKYWYSVDGGGISVSAGFDIRLFWDIYLRGELKMHHFSGEDNNGNTCRNTTREAVIGAVYMYDFS